MKIKKEFLEYAISLLDEFGFKYKKKNEVAFVKYGKFEICIHFIFDRDRYVWFSCKVKNLSFADLNEELTGSRYWQESVIIDVLTEHAFSWVYGYKKGDIRGRIDFKHWLKPDGLELDEACREFERLLIKFILPWFDKNKTYDGIRQTFRNGAKNGKLWKGWKQNTDFTPRDFGEMSGVIFQTFFEDFLISKLLNDDTRTAETIYNDLYRNGYETKFSIIDEKTGKPLKELEHIKHHFDALPGIIQRLDAVTPEQWEIYRKRVL